MAVFGLGTAVWLSFAVFPVLVAIIALSWGKYQQLDSTGAHRVVRCTGSWLLLAYSAPTWSH